MLAARAGLRIVRRGRWPAISVMAPPVLDAIFAATGTPVRSLPLKNTNAVRAAVSALFSIRPSAASSFADAAGGVRLAQHGRRRPGA